MHWLGFLPWWIWVPYLVAVALRHGHADHGGPRTGGHARLGVRAPAGARARHHLLLHRRPRLGGDHREEAVDARLLSRSWGPPSSRSSRATPPQSGVFASDSEAPTSSAFADTISRENGLAVVTADRAEIFPPAARSSAASRPTWPPRSASSTSSTSSGRTTSSPTRSPRSSGGASRPA